MNESIFELDLSKNDLSGLDLEPFAEVLSTTAIRNLDLSWNPIEDAGAAKIGVHFKSCKKLKILKLNAVRITTVGADSFFEHLYGDEA